MSAERAALKSSIAFFCASVSRSAGIGGMRSCAVTTSALRRQRTHSVQSVAPTCSLPQRQLLHAPVNQLADVQLVLAAAIDGVDRSELLRQLTRAAEAPDDAPIEFGFVDL